jgi:FAD/FMN-containing dehydrogenase
LRAELAAVVGEANVLPGTQRDYLEDATRTMGVLGHADAVVLPGSTDEVAAVVAWCYERDVAITPRGGGTGYSAGAVPDGGVVLSLERLNRIRSFDPLLWRIEVEAGVRTGDLRRIVRETGLFFPPDPGAAEQSMIGGNIAANAGGPHAFKYGVTGRWVTGLEAVVPPGEVVTVGGPIRKDVAGYDLKSLLIGSEGTLGVITAAWLRLLPAPAVSLPVVGFYEGTEAGCAAIERVLGSGIEAAAIEYLDRGCVAATAPSFPGAVPEGAGFLVLAEADGSAAEARRLADELVEALEERALGLVRPEGAAEIAELWRWRAGIAFAIAAVKGGKVSEDIVVPLDRLAEVIDATVEIGRRHGLDALSLGHAGDGNVHSNFLVETGNADELERAARAQVEPPGGQGSLRPERAPEPGEEALTGVSGRVEQSGVDCGDEPCDHAAARCERRRLDVLVGRVVEAADGPEPVEGGDAAARGPGAVGDAAGERFPEDVPEFAPDRDRGLGERGHPRRPLERGRTAEILVGERDAVVLAEVLHLLERPVEILGRHRPDVACDGGAARNRVEPFAARELRQLERQTVPRLVELREAHGLAAERVHGVAPDVRLDAGVRRPSLRVEPEPARPLPS